MSSSHELPELRLLHIADENRYVHLRRDKRKKLTHAHVAANRSTYEQVLDGTRRADVRLPTFFAEDLSVLKAKEKVMLRFIEPHPTGPDVLKRGFHARIRDVLFGKVSDINDTKAWELGYETAKDFRAGLRLRHPILKMMERHDMMSLNVAFVRFKVTRLIKGLKPVFEPGLGIGTNVISEEEELTALAQKWKVSPPAPSIPSLSYTPMAIQPGHEVTQRIAEGMIQQLMS